MLCHVTPRPIVSRLKMRTLNSRRKPLQQTVTSARRPRANQTPRNVTTRHVRHIFTQGNQTKPKIFLSPNQFVKCKQFNPIFIIALKAQISSSLHTIVLRKQMQTKHPIGSIFLCIFFLSLGLDTSKQSQSILTLIV